VRAQEWQLDKENFGIVVVDSQRRELDLVQTAFIALMVFTAFPRVPQTCKYAHGVPANITQAPLSRTAVGRPSAAASKGHMIIQCGPVGIAGLVLSLMGFCPDHAATSTPGPRYERQEYLP
jgi:hypothetical protein